MKFVLWRPFERTSSHHVSLNRPRREHDFRGILLRGSRQRPCPRRYRIGRPRQKDLEARRPQPVRWLRSVNVLCLPSSRNEKRVLRLPNFRSRHRSSRHRHERQPPRSNEWHHRRQHWWTPQKRRDQNAWLLLLLAHRFPLV